MRAAGRLLLLCLPLVIAQGNETIDAFGLKWTVPVASDWSVEAADAPLLHLKVPRPQEKPRRPKQFALADTADWQKVNISLEAKSPDGHLIIVYAYRDEAHFNYAHLSIDEATKQPVHNGIFHVYGGDRVRISSEKGPAAIPGKDEWIKAELTYDATTGTVRVTVNGKPLPAFEAVDRSLGSGKVGIGSFFNTAYFRNVKITGKPAK